MTIHKFFRQHAMFYSIQFVVMEADVIIATAELSKYPNGIPCLSGLYVDEKHRHCGIGIMLQEAREQEAKQYMKADMVALWVKRNSWMHKWYKRRGYGLAQKKEKGEIWLYKSI